MTSNEVVDVVLKSWRAATRAVVDAPSDFLGKDKETLVFRRVKEEIARLAGDMQIFGPDSQLRFDRWWIDLVCVDGECRIAIEGKYKIVSDGAMPDNRKAAFFDLFKLEQYADSVQYAQGLFLWLTDEPSYRQRATGDSADFSTHQGRVYTAGTPLQAARSRNQMPLPLVLEGSYKFDWEPIDPVGQWYSLAIRVGGNAT